MSGRVGSKIDTSGGVFLKVVVKTIQVFLRSEEDPTATEYALLLALVLFGAMAAISLHGCKVNSMYRNIQRNLPSAS